MTKFKVKPFTDYEKRRQMMESIEQYMKDSLVKVDAEKALIVLANHKPIWTVDAPGNDGEYRLFSYVMTAGHEMYRGWGVPGKEYGSLQDILFLEQVNMLDFMKAQWFVETTVLDELNPVKSAPGEEDGEVSLKSFAKAPSDTAKKDVEGRDYILMYSDMAKEDQKVRVGASVFIPKLPNGGGGGHYIVQRILGKDSITIHDMEDITESFQINYQKVTREDVKNEWFMSEEPSNIGREIVGVEVIENYFHDPRYLIYLKDEVFVTLPNEGRDHLPKSGKYEVEPQKVTVIKFASPEEIIAYVNALNLDRNQKETFRVAIHMKDITPVKAQEQGDENNG